MFIIHIIYTACLQSYSLGNKEFEINVYVACKNKNNEHKAQQTNQCISSNCKIFFVLYDSM